MRMPPDRTVCTEESCILFSSGASPFFYFFRPAQEEAATQRVPAKTYSPTQRNSIPEPTLIAAPCLYRSTP